VNKSQVKKIVHQKLN